MRAAHDMAQHDLVVIGGSAGGLDALSAIVRSLPASFPACVLVVVHASPSSPSVLPGILDRVSPLPVAFAEDGGPLEPGHIFVARPDFHLLVAAGRMALVHGPRENGFRPAVDPLFRTAARELGPRVIGVILSGGLADGTYGLSAIKQYGGAAIVQDPDDATIASMPMSAIEHVDVDHVLPASEIAAAIVRLTGPDVGAEGVFEMPGSRQTEPQLATEETKVVEMSETYGSPSGLTCPDCGGALWEAEEGRARRYQCHVGHQYAPENLEASQRDAIDSALWSAVRALEEHAELKTRMAKRAEAGGLRVVSEGFASGARDAHQQAQRIRSVLFGMGDGMGATKTAAARRATVSRRGEHPLRSKGPARQRRAKRKT